MSNFSMCLFNATYYPCGCETPMTAGTISVRNALYQPGIEVPILSIRHFELITQAVFSAFQLYHARGIPCKFMGSFPEAVFFYP